MPNYPTSLDTLTNPTSSDTLASPAHSTQHINANDIVEALEAKVGIGASTPTSGTVLTGTGTGSSAWQAAGGASDALKLQAARWGGSAFRSGSYYDGQVSALAPGTVILSVDFLFFTPFYCSAAQTFDRIGINVTTTGTAANARLGIYGSTAAFAPGALVLDAGTVAVGTTGGKEITISQALTTDTLYWLAIVPDGNVTVSARAVGAAPFHGYGTLAATQARTGVYHAHTYAALPNPASTVSLLTDALPSIRLRAV